jgi:hypothetical protein
MLPLPYPTSFGTLSDLSTLININASDFPLVAAWLVAALRGKGPYPILIFYGEQGSAKSTTARLLRSLIDPASASLRSEPKEVRDLMIAARNSLVLAFDNLSSIPSWLSDAMCRLATGGGFATRELYSDSEEMIFDAQRPCLLNGIEELSTRGDLLDRCLIVYLPNIAAELRRTEAEVLKKFEQLRPSLLGALLDHVAMALRRESSVSLAKLPRMADFAIWGTAAQIDGFIDAYSGNREQANNMIIESSTLASALVELAEERKHWQGTASDLLEELKKYVSEELRRNRSWPSTARSMSNALRRLAPNLRAANLEVSFRREGKKSERRIFLEKKGNFVSS